MTKLGFVLLAIFAVAFILGCSMPTWEEATSKNASATTQPATTTNVTTTTQPTTTTTNVTTTTPAQPTGNSALLSKCMQDCLVLNQDSTKRSKATWFNVAPAYCSDNCEEAEISCTVTFFHGETCEVYCQTNSTAICK
jgi:ABC-type Fe3+-hydroxamate transport system substrate-binding protein